MSLRERKKIRTKETIRRHALRLFTERGYAETTVEQVAEAAEVSPSTVFRYFATKERLIVSEGADPAVADAFRAQPADLSPIQAVRAAFRTAFAGLSEVELAERRDTRLLVLTVPELWAASLDNIKANQEMLASLVAERTGRAEDDPAVLSFAGAVFGIVLQVWLSWSARPELPELSTLDEALGYLERGLPL